MNVKSGCSKISLNTKGCCFLCLHLTVGVNRNENVANDQNDSAQLEKLCGYLHINLSELTTKLNDEENIKGEMTKWGLLTEATLCSDCSHTVSTFLNLFLQLEKVQMEMDYQLQIIRGYIDNAYQNGELVHQYSQRMTGDTKTLMLLAVVDKIRKTILTKCCESRFKTKQPRVQVKRINQILLQRHTTPKVVNKIKLENFEDTASALDEVIKEEENLESFSSAPSIDPGCEDDYSSEPLLNVDEMLKRKGKTICHLRKETKKKRNSSLVPTKMSIFCRETGAYNCTKCGTGFSKVWNCLDHFRTVHLKIEFKCDICHSAILKSSQGLRRHKVACRETFQRRKQKMKSYKHFCKICKKKFPTEQSVEGHVRRVHENQRPFNCDTCNQKFKAKRDMIRHRNNVHLKIYHKICECGRKCQNNYVFQRHLKNCKLAKM